MNGKRQRRVLAIATIIGAAFLAACNPPASDQHLQEQAAQATAAGKTGLKRGPGRRPGSCEKRRASRK